MGIIAGKKREKHPLWESWMNQNRDFQPVPNRAHPERMGEFLDRMRAENPSYDLANGFEDYCKVAKVVFWHSDEEMYLPNPYYQGEIPCKWCDSREPKRRMAGKQFRLECRKCGAPVEWGIAQP